MGIFNGAPVAAFAKWTLGFAIALPLSAGTPAWAVEPPVVHQLRNTWYYLVLESEFAGQPKDDVILNRKGEELARVSQAFRKAVDIEGSGVLDDGRVINFAAVVDRVIRYRVTTHRFGDGVGTCALVPFHSVAVDPRVVPLGTTIRIAETVGMRLPGGVRHNGIWKAVDVGGAIKRDRIDLFVGPGYSSGEYLFRQGITNLMPLTVEIVDSVPLDSCVSEPTPQVIPTDRAP